MRYNTKAMKTKKYTARTEENFEKLTKLMTQNPSTPHKTTAMGIGVLQKTIQRILSDFNLQPSKIQFTQALNEDYKQKRLAFAQNTKQLINDDVNNVRQILLLYVYFSKYGCGFDWPPFSPDIYPCDYVLWGFLKDQLYRQQFETIDE